MADSTFQVWDLVEFKSWEEMTKEFGSPGKCEFSFNGQMRYLCWRSFIIAGVNNGRIEWHDTSWWVSKDMIKLVERNGTNSYKQWDIYDAWNNLTPLTEDQAENLKEGDMLVRVENFDVHLPPWYVCTVTRKYDRRIAYVESKGGKYDSRILRYFALLPKLPVSTVSSPYPATTVTSWSCASQIKWKWTIDKLPSFATLKEMQAKIDEIIEFLNK